MTSASQIAYARKRRRKYEAQLKSGFYQAMRDTYNQVLAQNDVPGITAQTLVAAFNNPNQLNPILDLWRGQVDNRLIPLLLAVYRSAARDTLQTPTLARVAKALGPKFLDNIRNVRADYYLANVTNRVVGIGQTAFEDSQEALRLALESGLSVPKQADAVRRQLAIGLRRATTIARTEAGAAIGAADQSVGEEFDAQGLASKKEWLATSDHRTRPDHNEADGQVRPIKVPFDVGGEKLMFPCAPNGSAENVINCRCATALKVEE